MRDHARTVASLIGIIWLAGWTRYPELIFMMAALCLHWELLDRSTRKAFGEIRGRQARSKLLRNIHSQVSAIDAFRGRRP